MLICIGPVCTIMHHTYDKSVMIIPAYTSRYRYTSPHHLWTFLGRDISAGGSVGSGCGLFCRWGSSSGAGRSRMHCSADSVWRNPGHTCQQRAWVKTYKYPQSTNCAWLTSQCLSTEKQNRLWLKQCIKSHLTSFTRNDSIVDTWWFVSADFARYDFDLGCKQRERTEKMHVTKHILDRT